MPGITQRINSASQIAISTPVCHDKSGIAEKLVQSSNVQSGDFRLAMQANHLRVCPKDLNNTRYTSTTENENEQPCNLHNINADKFLKLINTYLMTKDGH